MTQKQPVGMAIAKFDYNTTDCHELNITKGEKLTLLDDTQHWWQVMNAKGDVGYVPSNFCKKSKQGIFSSLRNTLGRKKNKDNLSQSMSNTTGTAPSAAGRRSIGETNSPQPLDGPIGSPNELNSVGANNSNIGATGGSLKSSNSSNHKQVNAAPHSMSYNAGGQLNYPQHQLPQYSLPQQPMGVNNLQLQSSSSNHQTNNGVANHHFQPQQNPMHPTSTATQFYSKSPARDGSIGHDSSTGAPIPIDPHHQHHLLSSNAAAPSSGHTRASTQQQTSQAALLTITTSQQICTAKFSYTPCQPDELLLNRGDRIKVLEKSSDGWWRGELMTGNTGGGSAGGTLDSTHRTNQNDTSSGGLMTASGWFPSNYVSLDKHNSTNNNIQYNSNSLAKSDKMVPPPGVMSKSPTQYSRSPIHMVSSAPLHTIPSNPAAAAMMTHATGGQMMTHPPPQQHRYSTVLTLFAFTKNQHEELSFQANEVLQVIDRPADDPDWWKCRNAHGAEGLVPTNYVKLLTSSATSPPEDRLRLSYNRTGLYLDMAWYWGAISRLEAESILLKHGAPGQYLVRDSESHPGDFTVTMHAATDKCRNFKVHIDTAGLFIIGQKSFSSMSELIEHYRTHPIYKSDSERLYLTEPLKIQDAPSPNTTNSSSRHQHNLPIQHTNLPLQQSPFYNNNVSHPHHQQQHNFPQMAANF